MELFCLDLHSYAFILQFQSVYFLVLWFTFTTNKVCSRQNDFNGNAFFFHVSVQIAITWAVLFCFRELTITFIVCKLYEASRTIIFVVSSRLIRVSEAFLMWHVVVKIRQQMSKICYFWCVPPKKPMFNFICYYESFSPHKLRSRIMKILSILVHVSRLIIFFFRKKKGDFYFKWQCYYYV